MDKSTVERNTILLVNAGSHAYGTNLPTSDLDTRGVCVATRDFVLGLRRFEQWIEKEPVDCTVYELRKYLAFAADANPNILEIVFADDSDVLTQTPIGAKLRAHRRLFLSKKAKYTFSGYAIAQLKKIESHRRWLLNPPTAPPTRTEFGLPERTVIPKDQLAAAQSLIRKQIEAWENTLPTFGVDVTDPAQLIDMRDKLMSTL
ncbi:MAG: nucleotidyltransferase, partial [Desulfurellales bacterium]